MDWQDELRTLDSKLADGSISQAEYRKLRDQVLAEASSGGPVHRPAEPEPHERLHIPSSAADEEPSGEMTQVISGDKAAEQAGQVRTAPAPEPDADQTVIVGPQDTARPPEYQPVTPSTTLPPPLPWETGHAGPTPPVQGNEVFSVARKESPAKRVVLGTLAVLVVLALVGTGIWWFVLRDDAPSPPPAAGGPTQTQTIVPTDTDPGSRIPSLPGVANANDGTMSTDRAVQLKIIAPDEADLLGKQGIKQLVFRGSTGQTTGFSLIAAQNRSDAGKTTDAMRNYLLRTGFKDSGTVDGGYPLLVAHYGNVLVYRTVYTSGAYSVRIGVSRKSGTDADLRGDMKSALDKVSPALPRS